MAENEGDKLTALLAEGWEIAGYSTTIMVAGAMTHSILLRKGTVLVAETIAATGEKEVGRAF